MYHPKFLYVVLFIVLSSAAVSNQTISWQEVLDTPSEIEYLNRINQYVRTASTESLGDTIRSIKYGQEDPRKSRRYFIAAALVGEQFFKRDLNRFKQFLVTNWAEIEQGIRIDFIMRIREDDPEGFEAFIFDTADLEAYQGEIIDSISWTDPDFTIKHLRKIQDEAQRKQVASHAFYRMFNADMNKALTFAKKNPDLIPIVTIIDRLLKSKDVSDTLLNEYFTNLKTTDLSSEQLSDIGRNLSHKHPVLAFTFLETFVEEDRKNIIKSALHNTTKENVKEVVVFLKEIPETDLPDISTLKKVIFDWAEIDHDSAIEWTESLQDTEKRHETLLRISTAVAMKDLDLATDMALTTSDPGLRDRMIRNVAIFHAEKDLNDGLKWIDDLPEGEGKALSLQAIKFFTDKMDAGAILTAADGMADGPSVKKFRQDVYNRWTSSDIEAAAKWLYEKEESPNWANYYKRIGGEMADHAPSRAVEFILSQDLPQGARRELVDQYIEHNRRSPELMAFFFESLENVDMTGLVDYNDISKLASSDIASASDLIPFLTEKDQEKATKRIYDSWAEQDPVSLASAIAEGSISTDAFSRSTLGNIAESWARLDFDAAADWVESIADPETRMLADFGIAEELGKTHPKAATDYLGEVIRNIPESAKRDRGSGDRTFRKIITEWAYYDPVAATDAVVNSPLSEKTKESLITKIEEVRP